MLASALVAAWAFHDPSRGGFNQWEAAAFAMTLPAAVPGIVPLFAIGAWVFAFSDTQQGTDWAVTFAYDLIFAAFAAGNLVVLRLARRRPATAQS